MRDELPRSPRQSRAAPVAAAVSHAWLGVEAAVRDQQLIGAQPGYNRPARVALPASTTGLDHKGLESQSADEV